jgi:regulator-associated protein of mTOR
VTWMIWFTVDLQVLLSHSHRFRALLLLGRFLDMGAWAVDLVHPAIYKLNIVWEISQFPAWVLWYNAGCCLYRLSVILRFCLIKIIASCGQALSVGIFPYVLKLLQTTATDLRQILVFIWTKILALDKVKSAWF